jgi:hypothetical protein
MEMKIHVLVYGRQFVGYGFVEQFNAFVPVFHVYVLWLMNK